MVAIVIAATVLRASSVVGGLTVDVDGQGLEPLLPADELQTALLSEFPGLTACRVRDVKVKDIERFLAANPYVETVHATVSVGGRIVTHARLRRPVVRVFHNGSDFYADASGHCFPVRPAHSCDVIVASGMFRQTPTGDITKLDLAAPPADSAGAAYDMVKVWEMAKYLDTHGMSILYDQIYIDAAGDIVLQPKLGDYEVVIGDSHRLDEKFKSLKTFYAKGLPHAGYQSYSRVSVKYKGEVVCRRRDAGQH